MCAMAPDAIVAPSATRPPPEEIGLPATHNEDSPHTRQEAPMGPKTYPLTGQKSESAASHAPLIYVDVAFASQNDRKAIWSAYSEGGRHEIKMLSVNWISRSFQRGM